MSKILIADDSITILEMIGAYLRDAGYEIVTALDGVEAVEKTFTESPDLIILDIMMPRMNGYQTCRYLKNEGPTSHIPIILFTSKDQPADKFWGLQTGAEKYILKDMWHTNLLESVECLLTSNTPSPASQKLMGKLKPPGMAEILYRMNDLLDKNLYEATVMNQIGRLSLSSDNLFGTVKALFQLYETLISFPLAAIILGDRKECHIYFKVNSKVGTIDLDRLEEQIIKIFTDGLNEEDSSENKTLQIIVRDDSKELILEGKSFIEDLPQRLCHIPREQGVKIAGLITFCLSSRIMENTEDRERLKRISQQSFIVLEDAFLFDRLGSLSITDDLTGLYNRRHFFQVLDREYQRAVRHGRIFSLAIMDIDHFKSINDNYGHIAGDFVLKEMARIIQGECRQTDLFARFGGEEFSLLLTETPLEWAKIICERMRENIENHEFITQNQSLKITVSMGVTEFSGEEELSQKQLISLADEAMYLAKSLGRNRICLTEKKGDSNSDFN
jgi:two-component system cell cycle response regulator